MGQDWEGFKRTSPLTSNKLEATVVFKKAEVGMSDLGLNKSVCHHSGEKGLIAWSPNRGLLLLK